MATGQFWLLFFAFFLGNLTSQTVLTHQVAFFVDRGMDALSASYIAGLVGATSVVAKIFLGTLSDRVRIEAAYTLGVSFGVSGALTLVAFSYLSLQILPYLYVLLFAIGYAATAALPPVITGNFFGGTTYGRVFGTLMIANGLGGGLGTWGAGYIHDQTKSYVLAFLLVIGCFILSAYLIWRAARHKIKGTGGKRFELLSAK
jgi:MFS family permease